jgi:hypothetical protein
VKARRPRLQRLRFRVLDGRAREALLSMLDALGSGSPRVGARTVGSPHTIVEELARAVAEAAPLDSSLECFEARLREGGELLVIELRLDEPAGAGGPPRWTERPLGSARRLGTSAFELVRFH